MEMSFGKYRGRQLKQIPTDYLRWVWLNIELRQPLLSAVETELLAHQRGRSATVKATSELTATAREIVSAGYRQLAIAAHPDHGGKTEDMQRLNAAKAWLVSYCEKNAA